MTQHFHLGWLLALLLLGAACRSDELPPQPAPTPPGPSEASSNYDFFVADFVDSLIAAEQIPGLAIGMVREGRIDWQAYRGLAELTPERAVSRSTRFRLGPTSQVVTTVALLQVVEQAGLSLDVDLRPLLPFSLAHARFPSATISLRMLLSHVSGLRDRDAVLDTLATGRDSLMPLGVFLQEYLSEEGRFYSETNFTDDRPGKAYAYAQVNLALAAYLVEVLTERDFDIYCKTELFQQLDFTSVSWFLGDLSGSDLAVPYRLGGGQPQPQPQLGSPLYPSGQLRINLRFISRFWLAMIEGARYEGETLLAPSMLTEMQAVSYPFADAGQALGWRYDTLDNRPLLGLAGTERGMSARLYAEPTKRQGVIILTNGDWYEPALDSLTVRLLRAADALE